MQKNIENGIDKFFIYLDRFHKKKINDFEFKKLFKSPFVFFSFKNEIITLNSLDEIIKFYTNIRHVIYPNNCKPYEFRYTRQNKVSFTKLSNSAIILASQYVWHTSPNNNPRYVEAFSYLIKYFDELNDWRMCGLIEFSSNSYPDNWEQVKIPEEWKYNNSITVDELEVLHAPKI